MRGPRLGPPLAPAPIPSAVDPHTVERAWFRASRWSAPLYERPGRPGPRLLGSAWVDGGRDGSPQRSPRWARSRVRRPLHPRVRAPPPEAFPCPWIVVSGDRRLASALSLCGRASAQPGRSGPKAGAAAPSGAVSPPGGAERRRALEPVEKVVTQSVCRGLKSCAQAGSSAAWRCARGRNRTGRIVQVMRVSA